MTPARAPTVARRGQRGLAAVLFVLLIGLALAALVLGAMYRLRGTQAQAITVHAQTQAQLKAWTGAEALRQALFPLGKEAAAALTADTVVPLDGLDAVEARITRVVSADSACGGGTRVEVSVTGRSGGASSLLALVYCALGGVAAAKPVNEAIRIKGPLVLSGDLTIEGDKPAAVYVDGSVSGSGSLKGIDTLVANGDVTLGGSTSINSLSSNGSVTLSGSGTYTTVQALQDITLSGGVVAGSLVANGHVRLESNTVARIVAGGRSTPAGGDVSAAAAKIGSLTAQRNVTGTNTAIAGTALVQGNYTENSDGSVGGGKYGGSLTRPSWNTKILLTWEPGLQPLITPLTAQTVNVPQFDAYAYASVAHYRFTRDSSGRTVVTVRNIRGVADGSYFLVGESNRQDYLCSGTSYSAATCPAKICKGYSDYNSCFSYSNGTWTLAGVTMAPGVVWFSGNFQPQTGTYYNSFLVTGDIQTGGANVSYAVNQAGYAKVCQNPDFGSLAPTNYCPSGATALAQDAVGNIVFGAGGLSGSTYVGGLIDLTASNHVYGDVLAGDLVLTGGSTTVHGQVVASRQGSHSGKSQFGASTRIVVGGSSEGGQTDDDGPSARLLWSRYQ